MADKAVTYSSQGAVGILTIDKPPANSYDLPYMQDLDAAIDDAANDDTVRVALLRSASQKYFCAGADIKYFQASTPQEVVKFIAFAHQTLDKIAALPKVFIAVINGHALGGGLEIALACDLRFAGDGRYRLGLPEVTLGVLPGNGGTQRLPRLIGPAKALSLMITGQPLRPQEALALGLVDEVFPADSLWDEALAYAQKLASGATVAIGNIKRAVHQGMSLPLADGLALEQELFNALFETEDAVEGITAFVEKRQAQFKGR